MYSVRQYRNRIEIININTTDKRWNGGVMSIFTGAGVAIVTPMKANGEINYDKLAELLDYQINNSTDAIVICGTTGESATMTEKEHIEAIRFTADYVKKRVPVVAGTGSNCTKTAVELSKEAQAAGVDGCLVVTPYYNKATQKGLIEHYTAVARSIDLPIIMYNVPSRTGCNIQPETAVKLAREVDNIVAIKAATGNLSQESKTMMLAEGCLDMYSGEDGLIVPLMSIGAKGVISVLSNVAPKQTHDICAEFFAGNIEKSRQLQFEALELVDALFCEVNPIPVKTALNLMGMEVGPLRMPLCEMEEANLNKLKTALKGVISVLSNVAPKQTHDICAEFFAGNIEKSRQLQFEALELVDALFCEVNPIPVKTALNLMGMEVGPLRMPLCEMEEANLNKLKTALKNYGLIK